MVSHCIWFFLSLDGSTSIPINLLLSLLDDLSLGIWLPGCPAAIPSSTSARGMNTESSTAHASLLKTTHSYSFLPFHRREPHPLLSPLGLGCFSLNPQTQCRCHYLRETFHNPSLGWAFPGVLLQLLLTHHFSPRSWVHYYEAGAVTGTRPGARSTGAWVQVLISASGWQEHSCFLCFPQKPVPRAMNLCFQ